ncbi:unannotated protein [freshwater metagenome]|uniref:Unannotated protein n=1 Tax=freshwater metagenome TaxID=449393 RepID=A0A6J6E170_9ZZZZ
MVFLSDAATIDSPTMPLQVIMMAEKTVSRPNVAAPPSEDNMIATIKPTSITVTAKARIKAPIALPT